MTDNPTYPMENALTTRLRTARRNVVEAEAWLETLESSHPDYEEALEERKFWAEQTEEIEVALNDQKRRASHG